MKRIFLIFLVSVCFAITGLVLWPGSAYAPPLGCNPVAQNLAACEADLDVCEADLAECEAGECTQTFPGDGYTDPSFLTTGHGPALSYTDNGDGTATDNNTKFMWEVKLPANDAGGNCADGLQTNRSVHCVNNAYTWASSGTDANGTLFTDFLNKMNNKCDGDETTSCTMDSDCTGIGNGLCGHAGFRDWHIPNVKELQSIVDYGTVNPAIDSTFPGATATTAVGYWSATTSAGSSNVAFYVNFGSGAVTGVSKGFSDNGGLYARAVRLCP